MLKKIFVLIFMFLVSYSGSLVANSINYSSAYVDAGEVVNRENLKSFVQRAKRHLEHDFDRAIKEFRGSNRWVNGSIYLYILDMKGTMIFHGASPHLEGQDMIDTVDVNGTPVVKNILTVASLGGDGGGYTRYYWDNPVDPNDNDQGSPKTSYGILFSSGGKDYVVGSGIYGDFLEPLNTDGRLSASSYYVGANNVLDRDSLKSFVQRAKRHLEHDFDKAIQRFRYGNMWQSGSTYLYVLDMDGKMIFHRASPNLEGTNMIDTVDADGTFVVKKILADAKAGGENGGYTRYLWNDPANPKDDGTGSLKIGYVIQFRSGIKNYVVGSGIYYGAGESALTRSSSEPLKISSSYYVDANNVSDRGTLKSFVQRAKRHLEHDFDGAVQMFVSDARWRHGSIYLYVLDMNGNVTFHGASPHLEGQNLLSTVDANGTFLVKNILAAARVGGQDGGYTRYLWDNPADPNDDEAGSPKTGYAVMFKNSGKEYVVGSGIYDHPVPARTNDRLDSSNDVETDKVADNRVVESVRTDDRLDSSNDVETDKVADNRVVEPVRTNDPLEESSNDVETNRVIDKGSLKSFVEEAKGHLENNFVGAIRLFINDKRFIDGSTYLYVMDTEGRILFHSLNPDLEGQNIINLQDAVGTFVVKEIISRTNITKEKGAYFLYMRNSLDPSDDVMDSVKLGYASRFTSTTVGGEYIVGSGIYFD